MFQDNHRSPRQRRKCLLKFQMITQLMYILILESHKNSRQKCSSLGEFHRNQIMQSILIQEYHRLLKQLSSQFGEIHRIPQEFRSLNQSQLCSIKIRTFLLAYYTMTPSWYKKFGDWCMPLKVQLKLRNFQTSSPNSIDLLCLNLMGSKNLNVGQSYRCSKTLRQLKDHQR